MDGGVIELALFVGAAFVAALFAGATGFAFAPIAASVWLHFLQPLEVATLTVTYNFLIQGYGTWKLRQSLNWQRLWPFLIGGVPGVVIGISVLRWSDPTSMRLVVAVFLVLYSIYGLLRPAIKPVRVGAAIDTVAGFLGGVLGSMAGFPGILVVIWCGLRGWSKDEQRAVFQPLAVALLLIAGMTLAASESITRPIVELLLLGLPGLLLGNWAGFALYGRLNDETFRKAVLALLLASGLFLLMSFR